MNSLKVNCSQETEQDVITTSSQNEEINNLKRKLETYNAIVAERDELRNICDQIELWKERLENGHKKVFNELKTTCNVQLENLKKAMEIEYEFDLKLKNLQNTNDCINNQINTLRLSENKFQSKLTDYKQIIEQLMKELNNVKSELDEKNCEIEHLKTNLKSNENELCDVGRQLQDRAKECNRLNEINGILEKDLKCIKTKLAEVKECATRTEENLTLERETLCSELKIKGEILSEIEIQYDKIKCEINGEKYKVKQLTEKLAKVYKEKDYDQNELKNELVVLKNENFSKENDIRNLKKKIEKLQQENKCNIMEINSRKIQLEERECQLNLKQMTMLSERIDVENQTPIFGVDQKAESIIDKNTPNTSVPNIINRKTELDNLNYELENLKKDLGINFIT